ncbi:glycosyltransferase family 4 protein [Sphingomonas piscis]|uniref:Glycosyltransferase family 4 protein n=1 Tax=Sphingomonas piscis TaxID=2714943 RepID=A0A6G7YRU2_9SPHN|nr:glycosyltransferase [Sphingomonas piscis]QIK79452.1 glycosyltransferase family 4 protein [Sphingomonas piscis]
MIESASGGSANIMVALALHAAKRGHDVFAIYSPDRADPAVVEALNNGGLAAVRPSQMRRSIGPWDGADGLILRRTLTGLGKLDVIHSHSSKAGALARVFGRFGGTAQVYSPHGFYTMTGQAPFYIGPVERALGLLTDKIVAVSDYERRHAIDLGIGSDRVAVVENGIAPYQPLPRDEARRQLGLPADAFVIGFVGRLAPQKDPLAAVDVIDGVDPALNANLAIIGDGDLRAEAEEKAARNGSRVLFAGSRDAKPLFSAFDCLLCTSEYEGMPVSFLEALHCGIPIISYPVGGTEELVHDRESGFVVDPTPIAAARAIEHLARMSPAERNRLEIACRTLATTHTDATMGDATLELYRRLRR